MQQKELATLLGVSPAMVSRHAKQGMPTDTLERAEKWRRRHLEPGRVKGSRYNPSRTAEPTPPKSASTARLAPSVSAADMETLGELIGDALARGNQYGAAIRTWQLRGQLRQATDDASPRLSLRVWLALVGYMLHEDAEVRNAPDLGALLTPAECGARICPAGPWPAYVLLFEACDFDDDAINGYPECPDDGD